MGYSTIRTHNVASITATVRAGRTTYAISRYSNNAAGDDDAPRERASRSYGKLCAVKISDAKTGVRAKISTHQ